MDIGVIAKTNSKGQIVIPKEYRDELGITEDMNLNIIIEGNSIVLVPVSEVYAEFDTNSAYLQVLRKTKVAGKKD